MRIASIDYPECSLVIVVRSHFAKTYPNFVTFDPFFKLKQISKIRRKSEKFEQIDKSILAKKH